MCQTNCQASVYYFAWGNINNIDAQRKKQRMSKDTNIIMNDVSIRLDTLQFISKMLCTYDEIYILNHRNEINFSVTIWLNPFM